MNRIKKLNGLINQSNAEENSRIYIGYLWNERAEKKKKRRSERKNRKQNRKNKRA